jgi:hypothetical protein
MHNQEHNMRRMIILLSAACAVALSGCGSTNTDDEDPIDPITIHKTYNLTVGVSTSANVLSELGREPDLYGWGATTYTKETLPDDAYIMSYQKDGVRVLDFVIDNSSGNHLLDEVRIEKGGTSCSCLSGALRIGTTLADALAALGDPTITIVGEANAWTPDVLYKNIDGDDGRHYYANSAHGIRVFFFKGIASVVYIYSGSEKVTRD